MSHPRFDQPPQQDALAEFVLAVFIAHSSRLATQIERLAGGFLGQHVECPLGGCVVLAPDNRGNAAGASQPNVRGLSGSVKDSTQCLPERDRARTPLCAALRRGRPAFLALSPEIGQSARARTIATSATSAKDVTFIQEKLKLQVQHGKNDCQGEQSRLKWQGRQLRRSWQTPMGPICTGSTRYFCCSWQ